MSSSMALHCIKNSRMSWLCSIVTLRYLISEQDIKQAIWIFILIFLLTCVQGGIILFITSNFASRVENCSEIVKQGCFFNRYL